MAQITIQHMREPAPALPVWEAWVSGAPDEIVLVSAANEFVARRDAFLRFGCRFEAVRVRPFAERLLSAGVA